VPSRRRIARARIVAALAVVGLLLAAAPAAAAPKRHVYILWVDGTTLADWSSSDLPNFHALLASAAIALLSTRTEHESSDPRTLRVNAAVSFGAGARGAGDQVTGKPLAIAGVKPGVLGDALTKGGYRLAVAGDANGTDLVDHNAVLALAKSDGTLPPQVNTSGLDSSFPTGRSSVPTLISNVITGARASFDAFLVDPGDTERVLRASAGQPSAQDMRLAMLHVDAALGVIRNAFQPSDLLVVASASAQPARQRQGIRLGVVAIIGPGFGPGLLTSGTTRRDGVVSVTDLAPTIAGALGLNVSGVDGRVATVVPTVGPVSTLRPFERDIIRASLYRRALTRGMLAVSMGVVVLALLLLLAERAPVPPARRRLRAPRAVFSTLLVACAASPLALYVVGALHPPRVSVAAAECGAIALGLAIMTRAVLRLQGSLATVLLLTATVPLIDLLLGTPLGVRSPLAFQIAGGGRFYGVDDGVLGVVVGAEVFAVALIVGRLRSRRLVPAIAAVAFAASVWLLGAPSYGSKFGAALTAVPAFGVVAVGLSGKRFTWRSVLAIAIATVGVTGLLVGVDALRKPEAQSHVARAVEGRSNVGAIISRKIHAQWAIGAHTIWLPAILVFAAALGLVLWRRRDMFVGVFGWQPLYRMALVASIVGVIAGMVFNDGGVVTAAPIALFAATATFALLLGPSP
jgi:hypothetical protein